MNFILCFLIISGVLHGLLEASSYFLRVGDKFLLGAHDVRNCQESEGCVEVNVTQVWNHENYSGDPSNYNDIAVVK